VFKLFIFTDKFCGQKKFLETFNSKNFPKLKTNIYPTRVNVKNLEDNKTIIFWRPTEQIFDFKQRQKF